MSAIRRPFLTVPEAIETLATARRLAREGVDTHDLQLAAQEFIDEEAERLRRVRAKPPDRVVASRLFGEACRYADM